MLSGDYITGVFVGQIKQFDKMFSGTVFPPFADPEAQANEVAQDYWTRDVRAVRARYRPDDRPGRHRGRCTPEESRFLRDDDGDAPHCLEPVRGRRVPPVRAAGRNAVEDWTGTCPKYPFSALDGTAEKQERPRNRRKAAPTWSRVNELRLVANVVKHSEGDSADKLRAVNDAYLKPRQCGAPTLKHFGGDHMLGEPLTGEEVSTSRRTTTTHSCRPSSTSGHGSLASSAECCNLCTRPVTFVIHALPILHNSYSRRTSRAGLSSRSAMNLVWRR